MLTSIYAFGCGSSGQLGDGTKNDHKIPQQIQYFSDQSKHVKSISCGSYNTAFVTSNYSLQYLFFFSNIPALLVLFILNSWSSYFYKQLIMSSICVDWEYHQKIKVHYLEHQQKRETWKQYLKKLNCLEGWVPFYVWQLETITLQY